MFFGKYLLTGTQDSDDYLWPNAEKNLKFSMICFALIDKHVPRDVNINRLFINAIKKKINKFSFFF